jgi:hypothetical protein
MLNKSGVTNWIKVTQDRVQWLDFSDKIMNLKFRNITESKVIRNAV